MKIIIILYHDTITIIYYHIMLAIMIIYYHVMMINFYHVIMIQCYQYMMIKYYHDNNDNFISLYTCILVSNLYYYTFIKIIYNI